jgi:hypothetical protein
MILNSKRFRVDPLLVAKWTIVIFFDPSLNAMLMKRVITLANFDFAILNITKTYHN